MYFLQPQLLILSQITAMFICEWDVNERGGYYTQIYIEFSLPATLLLSLYTEHTKY